MPYKPRLTIPVRILIVLTTLLSTGMSLIGGVLLYLESISVLEETIESQSLELSKGVRIRFSQTFVDAEWAADMGYKFVRNFNGSLDQLSDTFKEYVLSMLLTNPTLYGNALFLMRENPLPWEQEDGYMMSSIWADPLLSRDGQRSKMYMYSKCVGFQGEGEPYAGLYFPIDEETGQPADELLPWNISTQDYYNDLLSSRNETKGWGSAPLSWYSADRTPYTYLEYRMTKMDLTNFPGYGVLMKSSINFQAWESFIPDYKTENDVLFVINAQLGIVYVHTLFEAPNTKPGCYSKCVYDCGNSEPLDCELRADFFGPTIESAMNKVSTAPLGTFFKSNLPKTDMQVRITFGEYYEDSDTEQLNPIPTIDKTETIKLESGSWFIRFSLIYSYHPDKGRIELLWMRPVSTVENRVFQALMQLVIFCIAIFIFDTLLAVGEYVVLALPLRRVAVSVRSLQNMDLSATERSLSNVFHTVGSSEVSEVVQGLLFACENLHEYRRFIPRLLFVDEDTTNAINRVSMVQSIDPPGNNGGGIAVVFTDIRSSTTLWDSDPSGMKESLDLHNKTIRILIQQHNGHEVKTIGDAFMIAFEECTDAVMFAVDTQVTLFESSWPASILQEDFASPVDGVWNGLRIRIGVDFGENYTLQRGVSGNVDYFGGVVNRAARVESFCKPGCVCFPDTVMQRIDCLVSSDLAYLKCPGASLRGFKEAVTLHLIAPRRCGGEKRIHFKEGIDCGLVAAKSFNSSEPTTDNMAVEAELKRRFQGTVATITIRLDTGEFEGAIKHSDAIKRICLAIDRSGGDALGLSGNTVTGGWNIQSSNTGHIQSSLLFYRIVQEQSIAAYIGISSGSVYFGKVGAKTQRFVTAFGNPTAISEDLCRVAVRYKVACLCGVTELPTMSEYGFRLIDKWTVSGIKHLIYQVRYRPPSLSTDDDASTSQNEVRTPSIEWGWGDAYHKAFSLSDGQTIQEQASADPFLSAVAQNLIQSTNFFLERD
eukprot:TRINITY_DN583_c0_g1_i1.p1 TRINITY_DN583_c0_g1~~TRINITY_DN583_c0_g1_i1.p1  ORF type:complete len:992 (+),score=152.57 TRINITY_DN583_c0_g1_i1:116-3091(+)